MKKLKEKKLFILILIFIVIILNIKFPYYIDAPGGISNMDKKININGYKSSGSFNLVYVKEYKATIPTLLMSLFNKDYKIMPKEDVLLDNDTYESYQIRDKLLMDESISNAIYVAYKSANKSIKVKKNSIKVAYVLEDADTSLLVGDEILSIDNKNITTKEELFKIINNKEVNDIINIKVKNNKKEYNRYAKIKEEDGKKIIGIIICNINDYDINPSISFNIDKNESGSSGGLVTALFIYNSLIEDDITNGLRIVGTGTIDLDGNVGEIGGIEYKLKSAVKNKADLFIVPIGDNYNDAIKLKKEKGYNIKIIGVSNFLEAINYLSKAK